MFCSPCKRGKHGNTKPYTHVGKGLMERIISFWVCSSMAVGELLLPYFSSRKPDSFLPPPHLLIGVSPPPPPQA